MINPGKRLRDNRDTTPKPNRQVAGCADIPDLPLIVMASTTGIDVFFSRVMHGAGFGESFGKGESLQPGYYQ